MKFGLFDTSPRHKFCPWLAYGPVMWRCKNAERTPNYAREWSISFWFWNDIGGAKTYGPWTLLPTVELQPWQSSCIASIDELGRVYKSVTIAVVWMWWNVGVSLALCKETKVGTGELAP